MTTVRKNHIEAAAQPGAHNPFGAVAKPNLQPVKTTFAPSKFLDPDSLEICDDEIPAHRKKVANRYESRFVEMKLGQALKVPGPHVSKVANAMRKWLADRSVDAHIRTIQLHPDCPQGMGRVWMMAGPQTATVTNGRAKSKTKKA